MKRDLAEVGGENEGWGVENEGKGWGSGDRW